MANPKTLLELSGANLEPAQLQAATLVIIDMQNEYLEGPLRLPDADSAVDQARKLLAMARESGTQIIHVLHCGREGGLFDRSASRGQAIDGVVPEAGEVVVEKTLPNAFANTDLNTRLETAGNNDLIIVGFMTHMCVSSTARAAIDHGYRITIDADACATRDLPDGQGGIVDAKTLNRVALTELSDRFAIIAQNHY